MPYIIDGHNLIPKIPGLSLDSIEDETNLIEMLQEFCRRRRKQVEVYFDNAPPGQLRIRKYGVVTARFTRAGQTADQAIRSRLNNMGRSARNWTVVSSDREVQSSAKAAKAQIMLSEDFAQLLTQTISESLGGDAEPGEATLSPEDLDDWLNLFGGDESSQ